MKQEVIWQKKGIVFLTALICCTLWGSASPAIKIGYQLFQIAADDTAGRILFAGVRFTLAGMMVILYASLHERKLMKPQPGSWRYVLILMCFQTIGQYVFFYMGLAHTSGVRGSIINAAGTFFAIFLAVFLFHYEKLSRGKVLGSLIGFAGVFLMVGGPQAEGKVTLAGEGAMTAAAFCSALAGCLIKKFGTKEDPVVLSGWQFLLGGLVMSAAGWLMGGRLVCTKWTGMVLLIYMAFISAGAYTLWSVLLKYNDVSKISILGFMNPVMGVLLSAVFLKEGREAMQGTTIMALVLVSIGIWLSQKEQ
jgi:drug/metabolite transporter (DMT)-like permease